MALMCSMSILRFSHGGTGLRVEPLARRDPGRHDHTMFSRTIHEFEPAAVPESAERAAVRARYWHRVRGLTLALLAAWVAVTVGVIWWARDLQGVVVFGWPLSFWAAAEGALGVFVLIVVVYAWVMDRLDAAYLGEAARRS